jgi:hypothetical protein
MPWQFRREKTRMNGSPSTVSGCALYLLAVLATLYIDGMCSANVAVDFFNEISIIYGTIIEFCTAECCPQMSAGPKYVAIPPCVAPPTKMNRH